MISRLVALPDQPDDWKTLGWILTHNVKVYQQHTQIRDFVALKDYNYQKQVMNIA
jgi:hypothetical protein